MTKTWFSNVAYQLFPYWELIKANRTLSKVSRADRQAQWVNLGRDKLLKLIDGEWERAKLVDEKLFKLTTVLSVAVTAGSVVSKTILDRLAPSLIEWVVVGLMGYSMLSLFAGALMGFSGIRPKPRAGYGPDFALKVRTKGAAAARACADALVHYEENNAIRANEASAALIGIRNGIVTFALAVVVSFVAPPAKPPAVAPASPCHCSADVSVSVAPAAADPAEIAGVAAGGTQPRSVPPPPMPTPEPASAR
jgi:hypothetical protein